MILYKTHLGSLSLDALEQALGLCPSFISLTATETLELPEKIKTLLNKNLEQMKAQRTTFISVEGTLVSPDGPSLCLSRDGAATLIRFVGPVDGSLSLNLTHRNEKVLGDCILKIEHQGSSEEPLQLAVRPNTTSFINDSITLLPGKHFKPNESNLLTLTADDRTYEIREIGLYDSNGASWVEAPVVEPQGTRPTSRMEGERDPKDTS